MGLRGVQLGHFQAERALQQNGRGKVGLQLVDVLQLLKGLGIALGQHQCLCVSHAEFCARAVGQVIFDQTFGFGHVGPHQAQSQPGRMLLVCCKTLRFFGGTQRSGRIACRHPESPQGGPGGGTELGVAEPRCQGFLNHRHCELLVAGALVQAGDGPHRVSAFLQRREHEQALERLLGLRQAIQAQQYLQHKTVGLLRGRQGFLPGFGGLERRISRARTQGELNRASENGFVAGSTRCVQQQGKGRRRVLRLGIEFAEQELVKKSAVHR